MYYRTDINLKTAVSLIGIAPLLFLACQQDDVALESPHLEDSSIEDLRTACTSGQHLGPIPFHQLAREFMWISDSTFGRSFPIDLELPNNSSDPLIFTTSLETRSTVKSASLRFSNVIQAALFSEDCQTLHFSASANNLNDEYLDFENFQGLGPFTDGNLQLVVEVDYDPNAPFEDPNDPGRANWREYEGIQGSWRIYYMPRVKIGEQCLSQVENDIDYPRPFTACHDICCYNLGCGDGLDPNCYEL